MKPTNILVATPCLQNMVTSGYCRTINALIKYSYETNTAVSIDVKHIAISDIPLARNTLAGLFLEDEKYSHLFFIDADMQFAPSLLAKYLRFDRPFVATLYPERRLDLNKFHQLSRVNDDAAAAERLAAVFVQSGALIRDAHPSGRTTLKMVEGFVRTAAVGAGAMLLRRDVFTRLREAYPELLTSEREHGYRQFGISGRVLQCFSPLQNEDGDFLSEDLSFCRRWTRCGGEIWACVNEEITHFGTRDFTSAYIHALKAGLF